MNVGVEINLDAALERLRSAVRDAGGNQAVAVKSGVPLGTLNNYVRGVSDPKASALAQIAYACGVSLDWLMTGAGSEPGSVLTASTVDHVEIARFPIRASAGSGEKVFDEPPASFWQVPREMLRGFSGNSKHLGSINLSGDSMEPTLHDGEPVIFDRSARHVDREGVYVLTVADDLFVKRVRRVPQGDGTIALELISDNPAYEKITLAPDAQEHVRIHGRVIWPDVTRRRSF